MRPELLPAIEALKGEVVDLENKVAAARAMTNRMCEMAGVPAVYPDAGIAQRTSSEAGRADLYYGKSITTAARELLETRNAAGRGPASPREIYDGLVAGGLQFESESETNRLVGLRATLRKNSGIFHKLPNGQIGLLAWYPKVRATKSDDDMETLTASKRSPTTLVPKRKTKPVGKPRKFAHKKSGQPVGTDFDVLALTAMADGKDWTCAQLKDQAIAFGDVGVDGATDLRSVNVRLLNLMRQDRVVRRGKGIWAIAVTGTTSPAPTGEVIHAFKGVA